MVDYNKFYESEKIYGPENFVNDYREFKDDYGLVHIDNGRAILDKFKEEVKGLKNQYTELNYRHLETVRKLEEAKNKLKFSETVNEQYKNKIEELNNIINDLKLTLDSRSGRLNRIID